MTKQFVSKLARGKRFVAALLAAAGLLGCGQKTESQAESGQPGYPLTGLVLKVDRAAGEAKIKHDDIPDFMPAMTMDFLIDPAEMPSVKEGERIRARLVRDDDGGFRLIRIYPENAEADKRVEQANQTLGKQVKALPSGRYLGPGDNAPDFGLYNQHGQVVDAAALKGKAFMMNFIFTRCTDANMCPRSTQKMAKLQALAKEQGIADLAFVSVSLDPEFDTPAVLLSYAEGYGIGGDNFHFVTGPRSAIDDLIKGLGVTALRGGETIVHSVATTLVGADGQILHRSEKSDWSPEEFLAEWVKARK